VPSLAGTEAVLDIDAENARARYWHTDVTFVPAFPLFSVLRSVVIPPVGGDTVWANTVAACETLPPVLRSLADQLWALHSNVYDYGATQPHGPAGAKLRDRVQNRRSTRPGIQSCSCIR
jgi:alpha-ketoglutarate-dependent sulfate ester dioxygenase